MNIFLEAMSNGLQKKILKEMSDPRKIVMSDIASQRLSIREHSAKLVIFENNTGDLNDWVNTLANIFNYVNNMFVKSKTSKLKYKEYLELAFGINESFDSNDASSILDYFDMKFSKKFPNYNRTDELEKKMYNFYNTMAKYFSSYFSTCKEKKNRISEFEEKIKEFLENA